MVVAEENGVVVAHLLATLRRRGSLIPPYLFTQGRIYGEGEYSPDINKEEVFKLMLSAITQKLKHKLCLNIEFSDLSQKMFGYKHFKQEGYFPVHWMEVHNSLQTGSGIQASGRLSAVSQVLQDAQSVSFLEDPSLSPTRQAVLGIRTG